jgi:hypothetical protein
MANDRISQAPVEVALSPTSGKARTSQEPAEVILSPTSGQARTSQAPIEVILQPTSEKARVSQLAVEVLVQVVLFQDVALGLIDRTAVAHAPTVATTGNQFITLNILAAPAVAFQPSVSFPGQITLPLIDRTAQAALITVASKQTVTLPLINRTAVAHAPTVLLAAPQTVTLGLLDRTAVAFAPFVWHTTVDGGGNTVPEPGPGQEVGDNIVELLYNGIDIIDDVVISDATFSSSANGIAGECHVRIKDTPNTRSFVAGKELLLRVNGLNVWRGYVITIRRVYAFEAEDRSSMKPRFFMLDGWDINVLFLKRIVFDQDTPLNLTGRWYRTDETQDITVLRDLFSDFLDLSNDDLNTTKLVENVGPVNMDHPAAPIQPSYNWANSMRGITALTNAIWYIDPDKCVVHTDVDTPNAPYDLSDVPNGTTSIGYREMQLYNDATQMVNDALIWGLMLGGNGIIAFHREEDATSISSHGRWQYGELNGSMYKQATVTRRAESLVDGSPLSKRGGKIDKIGFAVTVFQDGFRVAQKVDISSEVFGFNDVIPIRRMDISFATKKKLRYRLYISHEIDMPWNYFDNYYYNFSFPDIPVLEPVFPPFPPVLPPNICDPEDFLLGTSGGAFSCITATGADGCFSWNETINQGDIIFLYGGATYHVEYVANRHDANEMAVHITAIGGAPRVSFIDMGKITDGDATSGFDGEDFTVPDGFTGWYGVGVQTTGYVGFEGGGMSVSASVGYVSGPDPRFEGFDCADGDPGFGGIGDSQENDSGDGTSVVYQLTGAYVPGTTIVFVGGFFQRPGHEYTESDPAAGEITFTTAPTAGESIVVFYTADGERTV